MLAVKRIYLVLVLGPYFLVSANSTFRNVVYFVNWGVYDRNYHIQNLPAEQITHVHYAFANLLPDGTVIPGDAYADTMKLYDRNISEIKEDIAYGAVREAFSLKLKHRHIKVLLAIGGWTWSSNFAVVASTLITRQRFARSAVALMGDWGFDGIDIDWEFPASSKEAENYVLLLQAIRDELDTYALQYASGHHFLLTAAVPAGPSNYKLLKLPEMAPYLDYINLMTYDFAGSWSSITAHQANIFTSTVDPLRTPFSILGPVNAYLEAGFRGHSMNIGIPLYGRSFTGTSGLGEIFSGSGRGSWEKGIWDYRALPKSTAVELYDDEAGATYSWDNSQEELVSYDNRISLERKIKFVSEQRLGGLMFWEASGDAMDERSLIAFAYAHPSLTFDSTENFVYYPQSRYRNIRDWSHSEIRAGQFSMNRPFQISN